MGEWSGTARGEAGGLFSHSHLAPLSPGRRPPVRLVWPALRSHPARLDDSGHRALLAS